MVINLHQLFSGHLFQIASMGVTNATKPKPLCGDQVVSGGVAALQDGPASEITATVHSKSRVDVTFMQGNQCLNVSKKQLFHNVKKSCRKGRGKRSL